MIHPLVLGSGLGLFVAGAFGLERLGGAGTTGAELDAGSEVLASGNRTVAIA